MDVKLDEMLKRFEAEIFATTGSLVTLEATFKGDTLEMEDIVRIVCEAAGEDVEKFMIECKMRHKYGMRRAIRGDERACFLRYMCYRLAHPRLMTLSKIGAWFGGRDHTTIMNGLRVHGDMMATHPWYRETFIRANEMAEAERVRNSARMRGITFLPVPFEIKKSLSIFGA